MSEKGTPCMKNTEVSEITIVAIVVGRNVKICVSPTHEKCQIKIERIEM